MKRGSIALARRLCVEIAGLTDEEGDMDGRGYGSVDIAEILSAEVERLRKRINSSPIAIMDTRDVLGICAPTEDAFPALYAIQGKRVRLVLDDEVPNAEITGSALLRSPG